jgi:Ca2+:H+ antiporter
MPRWLYPLLIAAPFAVVAAVLHAPAIVSFGLSVIALIPLAGLIGRSTEDLAQHVGALAGGLLNATFGNAAELIIGVLALQAGLTDVVKATITGSIIGNALLVLGTAIIWGGWVHGTQFFNARHAGQYAAMLALAVVGLALPALANNIQPGQGPFTGRPNIQLLSALVAAVLLACYGGYLAYAVFGVGAKEQPDDSQQLRSFRQQEEEKPVDQRSMPAIAAEPSQPLSPAVGQDNSPARRYKRSAIWLPMGILFAATVGTAVVSEILVQAIEPVTHQLGWSTLFVGLIIIPIAGNAAEHASAVTMAVHNHMDITMAITAGSSIQVALLVAPVLVLLSLIYPIFPQPLDLVFTRLELVILALVMVLYALISLDGESSWLEGLLLVAFYAMVAITFFLVPS